MPEAEKPKGLFAPSELERYARHIVLREIGGPGQKALKQAKVAMDAASLEGSDLPEARTREGINLDELVLVQPLG